MVGFFSVPVLILLPSDYRAIKTEHGAKLWRDGGVMAAFLPISCRGDLFSEAAEVVDFQASEVARPPRLERGTLCLEGRCSIQLSYGRNQLLTSTLRCNMCLYTNPLAIPHCHSKLMA